MSSCAILTEIDNRGLPPRECVACGKEVTPIDIATQAVQKPGAGMHTCQTCLPIEMDWYDHPIMSDNA